MTKPLFIHRNMADKMGTRYLQQTLNMELGLHIRQRMPEILKDLENILKSLRSELKNSGYDGGHGRSGHYMFSSLLKQKACVSVLEANHKEVGVVKRYHVSQPFKKSFTGQKQVDQGVTCFLT